MTRAAWWGGLVLAVATGCGGAEVKLGQNIGLSPLKGYTRSTLDTSACGTGDCRISFARDVEISTRHETDGLADYIKAIDLEFKGLSFEDDDLEQPLSFETQVREATVNVGEGVDLSKAQLMAMPQTVRLIGPALEPIRADILAHNPAKLTVKAELVVSQPIPRHLLVRYWVQPVLVIGPQ
ncbi:MAG: hypothetical protein IPJ65_40480 [Archangiaceae bacterium]|nr:hypothetical protein [Archangiaceae bacterium]